MRLLLLLLAEESPPVDDNQLILRCCSILKEADRRAILSIALERWICRFDGSCVVPVHTFWGMTEEERNFVFCELACEERDFL